MFAAAYREIHCRKRNTTKLRFTLLAVFFKFAKNSSNPDFLNSCDNPAPLKLFKAGIATQFKIMDEDVVDAIIFRTWNPRNLLMLELMVWSCMRVGEVLKLKPKDMKIVMLSLPEKVIKQVLTKMVFLR